MGQGKRKRGRGVVLPFGLLLFAAFAYFSVWGWLSIGQARAFRSERCAADAPISAPCRTDGTATVTGTFAHYMPSSHGGTLYGITYTGHGRIPNAQATFTWGNGRSPLPAKNQVIDVTTWQGTPIYLSYGGTTVTVNTPPDRDPALVAGFADVAALAAVCAALLGRPLPYTRRALRALRVVDWIWLPGLVAGYLCVSFHFYRTGFAVIDVAGGGAFLVSEALHLRLLIAPTKFGIHVGDDPDSPPSPGLRAERERRRRAAAACPVAPSDQRWIESELSDLCARFDIAPGGHEAVVPGRDFYPVAYDGRSLEVQELVRKLCGVMGVDFEMLWVRLVEPTATRATLAESRMAPYSGHHSPDTFDPETELDVIDLDRTLADEPPVLTAVLVHELAHLRLGSEPEDAEGRAEPESRREQQADLLGIAFGLGLFGANLSFRAPRQLGETGSVSLGGLDRAMYGYALACWTWLRDERNPQWANKLGPVPRRHLDDGLRYLGRVAGGGGLPTLTATAEAA